MRCFIAIDIDDEIRAALGDLQKELQGKADIKRSDVKWVNPKNIHLTLKFLGEVADERIVEICSVVEEVAGRHKIFDVDIGSVGHFGGRSARVVWIGAGEGNDSLLQLQKDLEQQLAQAGWPEEARKFTGHLTLCRIRNPKAGFKLAQMTEAYGNLELGTVPADSITVYQSQLTPSGPIYTVLADYKLK
jgi:2'-5' RNA ligase